MPQNKNKYLKLFFAETDELLTKLGSQMVDLEANLDNMELVNEIFRVTHTIKGNSAAMGFDIVSEFAHKIENVFDKIRNGELKFTREIADVTFESLNELGRVLSRLKKTGKEPGEIPEITTFLDKIDAGDTDWIKDFSRAQTTEDIKLTDTVRVPLKQLDELINYVGEMLMGVNRLDTINRVIRDRELKDAIARLRRVVSDFQYSIMAVRLVPLSSILDQFPKMVRDIAQQEGKEVSLTIRGADIQLDSKVIERIKTPLIHIIRNAIFHGIESPLERKEAGKSEVGNVAITAWRGKGRILLSIVDDGRGVDPKKIADKAVSLGIAAKKQIVELKEEDILDFLFAPGFTTAEKADQVAGRGVGLDIVRAELSAIGGIISFHSTVGLGSDFTLDIPLSIATIKTLLCKITGKPCAIPVNTIDSVTAITVEEIHTVSGEDNFMFQEELVPLVDVGEVLYNTESKLESHQDINVIVVNPSGKRVGLIVDSLVREEEIVVKSFDVMSDIRCVSGASILGDGSVVLILDPSEIVKKASIRKAGIDGR